MKKYLVRCWGAQLRFTAAAYSLKGNCYEFTDQKGSIVASVVADSVRDIVME